MEIQRWPSHCWWGSQLDLLLLGLSGWGGWWVVGDGDRSCRWWEMNEECPPSCQHRFASVGCPAKGGWGATGQMFSFTETETWRLCVGHVQWELLLVLLDSVGHLPPNSASCFCPGLTELSEFHLGFLLLIEKNEQVEETHWIWIIKHVGADLNIRGLVTISWSRIIEKIIDQVWWLSNLPSSWTLVYHRESLKPDSHQLFLFIVGKNGSELYKERLKKIKVAAIKIRSRFL